MGSLPRAPRLSDQQMIEKYQAGEGRTMIALRAKVSDQYVREVLARAGVELRTAAESRRLSNEIRMATNLRTKLRLAEGQRARSRTKRSLADWPKAA